MSFTGKVALITGGTKGIGKAVATKLVKQGAKVAVNYGSDGKAADDLLSALGQENIITIQADAGSLDGITKMVNETTSRFGKIDILIPNAAVLMMKTVESTDEADFDRAFRTNVKGPYFLVQKAVPHMSPGSRVVLMSTTLNAASTVTAAYTLYCATKGAIDQMVRTMSKDLGTKGISVNAVAPGPTGTDLFFEGKSEQLLKTIAGWNPYNRIGEPDEVADAIVYLSGQTASWISGQILRVNGGMA